MKKLLILLTLIFALCLAPTALAQTTTGHFIFKDVEVTNNGDLDVGQYYEVTGKAYYYGGPQLFGAVIETGESFYGIPLIASYSGTGGVCGDDLTVGVKFNINPGEWIAFKLRDKATRLGRFGVMIGGFTGCGGEEIGRTTYTINVAEPTPTYTPPATTTPDYSPSPTVTQPSVTPTPTTSIDYDLTPSPSSQLDPKTDTQEVVLLTDLPAPKTGIAWYFDYKDNTNVAVGLTAMILLILGIIAWLIFTRK